jgi:hypothetical protein
LEKDTPGQIFGITFKSDGKSEEKDEESFTQRPKNEDLSYEEHDTKSYDQEEKKKEFKYLFMFGFALFAIFAMIFLGSTEDDRAEDYRDYTYQKRKARQKDLHDV